MTYLLKITYTMSFFFYFSTHVNYFAQSCFNKLCFINFKCVNKWYVVYYLAPGKYGLDQTFAIYYHSATKLKQIHY